MEYLRKVIINNQEIKKWFEEELKKILEMVQAS